jgi:hypothetical protein
VSDTHPGADELNIREILRIREVGPSGIPPQPTARPRDWLDDLIDYNAPTPTTEPEPALPEPPPQAAAEPEDGEREPRDWTWLTGWIRPWHTLGAGAIALFPAVKGYSLATGWAAALHDMRTDHLAGAYTTATLAVAATFALDLRRGRLATRVFLITAVIGGTGVLDWFDPITFVTGVTR